MQIKNDPHGSARYGASAARLELRQNEARSELLYSQILDRQFKASAVIGQGRREGADRSGVVAAEGAQR